MFQIHHLVAVMSMAALSTVEAVTLVNGSFEDLSSSYMNTAETDSMSGVAADGWTISSNSPDWFLGAPGPAGLWLTNWGNLFAVGAAIGSGYREGVSQTITGLTVGENYAITFHQANGLLYDQGSYVGVGTVGGWEVLVDGGSILTSASVNDNSTPAPAFTSAWSESVATFTATASSQTIEFLAYGGSGGSPTIQFLDEVSVAVVPEPEIGLLAGIGVLALIRRRRSFSGSRTCS